MYAGNKSVKDVNTYMHAGNKSVKDELINFDSRKITPEIRSSVTEILATKGHSFEHATIYRVSVAAAPLAAWVKANLEYSTVLHKIAPLEQVDAMGCTV